jgi:hypothetical protein
MEAVTLWREPLIKDLDAHEASVHFIPEGGDGGERWDDQL